MRASEAQSDELTKSPMDPLDLAPSHAKMHSPASPALHGRPVRWVELTCPPFGLMVQVKLVQHQLRLLHPGLEVSADTRTPAKCSALLRVALARYTRGSPTRRSCRRSPLTRWSPEGTYTLGHQGEPCGTSRAAGPASSSKSELPFDLVLRAPACTQGTWSPWTWRRR